MVSEGAERRPLRAGEARGFAALAEALATTGVATRIEPAPPADVLDPGTAVILPADQLVDLLGHEDPGVRAAVARTVVVEAPRDALAAMLDLHGVAAAVEARQYGAWRTGAAADAALAGRLDLAGALGLPVTTRAFGSGPHGLLRTRDPDLPGLMAAYLRAYFAHGAGR